MSGPQPPTLLLLLAVACFTVSARLDDAAWQDLYAEVSECTSIANFCQEYLSDSNEVVHAPTYRTQAHCEAAGHVWHERFAGWEDFRRLSTYNENQAWEDEGHHVWIVRVSESVRLNSAMKRKYGDALNTHMEDHFRCHDTHYLMLHLTAAQATSDVVTEFASVAAALPTKSKRSALLAAYLSHDGFDGETVNLHVGLAPGKKAGQKEQAERTVAKAQSLHALLKAATLAEGAEVQAEEPHRISLRNVHIKEATLVSEMLSESPEALWIEPALRMTTRNNDAAYYTQSNVVNKFTVWDHDIQGQGQIVGVADTGLDHEHCMFRDDANPLTVTNGNVNNFSNHRKIRQYAAFADNAEGVVGGHGTHVAGSVLGDSGGNPETTDAGMAYEAKVAFFDIGEGDAQFLSVPSVFNTMLPVALDVGARIHSNSWGSSSNVYDSIARDFDRFMFNNNQFLALIAAGNDGSAGAGSLGTPATLKNGIAVGAAQNTNVCASPCQNMASFSSRGPRFDGAIAPTMSAPGQTIRSARSAASGESCSTFAIQGTSMATPVLAGNAALVRQYFMEGWYPTGEKVNAAITPTGALIKAILVNGARHLTGSHGGNSLGNADVPDNFQGHGAALLANTLVFKDDNPNQMTIFSVGNSADEVNIDDGAADHTYTFTASSSPVEIRATLAWTEPQGTSFANDVTVNDLDITVSDGTTTFFPNGLNAKDSINNPENVIIPTSSVVANRVYTVRVKAASVPSGPQAYALVVTGPFSEQPDQPDGDGPGNGSGDPTNGEGNGDGEGSSDPAVDWKVFGAIAAGSVIAVVIFVFAIRSRGSRNKAIKPLPQRLHTNQPEAASVPFATHEQAKPVRPQRAANNNSNTNTGQAAFAHNVNAQNPAFAQWANMSSGSRASKRFSQAMNLPPLPPARPTRWKDQWSEHTDPNTGRKYFFNQWTGQSAWTDPRKGDRPPV